MLVLWAGPALSQTMTITHTGSATVTDGKVQIVEGGASTTFQVSLSSNFISDLKTTHPEAARTGALLGAILRIYRSSTNVTWTTGGTGFSDRTDEFEISYGGTALDTGYLAAATIGTTSIPESLYFFVPLDTANSNGETSTYMAVDSFTAGSFPNTFTIEAETDTTYVEEESITVRVWVVLVGASATPSFSTILIPSNELTFDLVEGALPDPTGKPTTPANLTATAGKGAVTLTWDAIDDTSSNTNLVNDLQIDKHQYCQKTDTSACADADWTDISNSAYGEVNANTYTIGSLTNGTAYTFQVRAVNGCTTTAGCGIGDAAAAVTATPVADARTPPTGLTATAGNTQVTLTWTDPGDATITFYEYQQKAGLAPFGAWTPIPGSNAATTSYRLTGLDNGTVYGYRIRAGRGTDVSLASDTITVTPQRVPPAAPVLTAVPRNGGVTLSWPNPGDPTIQEYEYQYQIGAGAYGPWQTARQRSEEECGSPGDYACLPPYFDTGYATLRFAVDGLSNGTPHTFRIRAVNADGKTISNEASTTPVVGVPAKPTGLTTGLQFVQPNWRRFLRWDRVADASILRYEFTVDAGRTWSFLQVYNAWVPFGYQRFDEDEYLPLEYIFRIRAVNAVGPGPASEPSVVEEETETVAMARPASNIAVEWDSGTTATLVWDQTEHDDVRGWSVYFNEHIHGSQADNWNTALPVGTTRFEIPGTFNGGDDISVIIAGCLFSSNCLSGGLDYRTFRVGTPREAPSGFSATPGDAQITLAWDAPTDSSVTSFHYQVGDGTSPIVNIPDGDDADTDAGNETGYIVTGLDNGSFHSARLRAVNAHGAGPWTEWIRDVMPLAAGVPAAPSGLVTLHAGDGKTLTTWDDPQDPSINGYQQWDFFTRQWQDIPGSDATTTGAEDLIINLGTDVRVRAVNANGVGPYTQAIFLRSPAPPRPTGLQAEPGNGRVALTWDDAGKGVYIQSWRYSADGGETWNAIPDSGTTAQGQFTRYTVPNLANGQTYTFAILAENNRGIGPPSAAVTATPQAAAPAKPAGLMASPGNAEATLTWDDPRDAGITRYQVKQGSANWADVTGSDTTTTSHTVGTLTNGTAYTFQIRAVNDHNGDGTDDPGTASDAVTVTPGVPAAPASLSVAPGNAQATLTWTAPAETNGSAVTGYEYTSNADAATPTWTDVPDGSDAGTDRADETEYAVTGLDNNTAYAFAVRAENANGQGVGTPSLRAVPVHPDAPQRPAGLRAIPGHELVRLTWALPNVHHPVTSYQYRQSTNGGATWSPDWTAITDSDADTTEHLLTGLANGTTYTFELRALNGSIAGPTAGAQATPSPAAARKIINYETNRDDHARWRTTAEMTAPDGSTYTVTQISPPAGLDWQIAVPGTTEIGGRTFTVRSLQGTTPYTSPGHTFTSTGQEGLDVVVHPSLAGPAQVCLQPSDLLRLEAGNRPLVVLRYSGASWTALPTTGDGDMLCGTTAGFSAFVLGYAAPASQPGPGPAPAENAAPQSVQAIPPQTMLAGTTSEPLDLTAYFHEPDGEPLTYAAVSDNPGVLVVDLPQGSSRLTLRGVAAGEAVVTVTASDPHGGSVSQTLTVTVTVQTNAAPEVAQLIPPQTVVAGAASEPLNLTPYFHDPDGDPLTYAAASANAEVATAGVADDLLTLTGVAAGTVVVTVTARDPYDAEASQTVAVTVKAAAPVWLKAWVARFGRTVSGQVLDGVQERLRVARRAGFQATLAGRQLGGTGEEASQAFGDRQPGGAAAFRRELDALAGWTEEQMTDPTRNGAPQQALTGRDLLTSSAFTLTGGNADGGFGALWGRGVVSRFDGRDGSLSVDGEVATGMVGIDWVSGRWLTGLALAMSRGTGGYRAADDSGDIESTLTGLYPWLGYHLTDRLSVWAAAGYGAGVLTLTPQNEAAMAAELSLSMVAAGARSEVLRLPHLGGITLAVETDTRLTRTATGATARLQATDASVWQLRLGLEGSRHVALDNGGALRPSIELGLRQDGGDAETGGGIEMGAGLSFTRPASGLSLDLAARGLLAHRASGLEEWGASASLTYDPTPSSDRGLSMSLQQSAGASSSGGVNALLARETMATPAAGAGIDGASRLEARAGYGLPLGEGRFIGTPQLGFGLSGGRHDYTLGWHLSVARQEDLDLTVGIEASRRENPDASDPDHGVMLQVRLGH